MDLSALRQILEGEAKISLARVERVEVTSDLSTARALCTELPNENEVIAQISFPHCSQGNGFFVLPSSRDLGILIYADEQEDPILIGYLANSEDPIPQQVADGDAYIKANKQLHLAAVEKVLLGKGVAGTDPDEALVLGNQLLAYLTDLHTQLDAVLDALQTGTIGIDSTGGPVVPHPDLIAVVNDSTGARKELDDSKTTYITDADTNIVSQVAFTERGD